MIQVSNLDPKPSEINKLRSDLEQTQTTIVRLENTLAEERKSLRISKDQAIQSTEKINKLRAELNMATALKEMREETIEERTWTQSAQSRDDSEANSNQRARKAIAWYWFFFKLY